MTTQFDVSAICLRATPFREADLVVTFYTAEHGKLGAMAKGVKKSGSKLAGACEPLTLNRVFLARGRNLHTLCHYDRQESFPHLREDLERLAAGTVCVDIVRLLGQENDTDSAEIFELLSGVLQSLNQPDNPWMPPFLHFQVEMLRASGYLFPFFNCIACDLALDTEQTHHGFYLALGGFLCSRCQGIVTDARQRVNVSTGTLHLLTHPDGPEHADYALRACKFLAYYWGHRLESEVGSYDFLFQLFGSRPTETVLSR